MVDVSKTGRIDFQFGAHAFDVTADVLVLLFALTPDFTALALSTKSQSGFADRFCLKNAAPGNSGAVPVGARIRAKFPRGWFFLLKK